MAQSFFYLAAVFLFTVLLLWLFFRDNDPTYRRRIHPENLFFSYSFPATIRIRSDDSLRIRNSENAPNFKKQNAAKLAPASRKTA